jgi:hypothetical protein
MVSPEPTPSLNVQSVQRATEQRKKTTFTLARLGIPVLGMAFALLICIACIAIPFIGGVQFAVNEYGRTTASVTPLPTSRSLPSAMPTSICRDIVYIEKALKLIEQKTLLVKRVSITITSITPYNISEMEQILRDFQKLTPPDCFKKVHSLTLDELRDELDALYLARDGDYKGAALKLQHATALMEQTEPELNRIMNELK